MVSSHPEVVVGLRLMKNLGVHEELKRRIREKVCLKGKIF